MDEMRQRILGVLEKHAGAGHDQSNLTSLVVRNRIADEIWMECQKWLDAAFTEMLRNQ